jgi:uncharacterized protein (TIGR02266 family)
MEGERRKHARKRISTAVAFREPGGTLLRGWLVDISRGGCFIATPSHLTFGEPLEIELRLPGIYAQITGTASVVWIRETSQRELPAGMGIRFVAVAESTLAAIDGLSGTGARLSRPSTVIGLAPAPATSSPSIPAPKLEAAPPPEPDPLPEPAPKDDAEPELERPRWIVPVIGGVMVGVLTIGVGVALTRRHRVSTPIAQEAAAQEAAASIVDASIVPDATITVVDASVVAIAIVDASIPDAQIRDAGRDGGKLKPKPKPKRH